LAAAREKVKSNCGLWETTVFLRSAANTNKIFRKNFQNFKILFSLPRKGFKVKYRYLERDLRKNVATSTPESGKTSSDVGDRSCFCLLNGRVSPSNGRVSPSNGRVSPSQAFPIVAFPLAKQVIVAFPLAEPGKWSRFP